MLPDLDKRRMAWYRMQLQGIGNDLAWLQVSKEGQDDRKELAEAESYVRAVCCILNLLAS